MWPEQVSGVCLIAMAAEERGGWGAEGRLVLFSQLQRLWLLTAPALTRGLGRETEKGSQSGATEVRKRLGMGQGVCDRGPTAAEGGRGREGESRGGGEQGNRQPRPAPSTPLPAGSDDSNDAERQSEVTIRPEGRFARQTRLNGTTRTATRRREICT